MSGGDASEVRALRDAVARAVAARPDPGSLWSVLCDQIGVAALAVPQERGGAGGGLPELAAVGYELGAALAGGRFLGTVLSAQTLCALGDGTLLPGVSQGRALAALCWAGEDGGWDPERAAVTATGGRLTGGTHHVLDGVGADVLLVVAEDAGGTAVFAVDPADAVCEVTPSMDESRSLARVRFHGAPGRRLPGPAAPALRQALDAALVVQAAENAGAARHCLDTTVAYSRQRVQFGRPIGGFQALKHRMADMYVRVEAAESAAFAAAAAADIAPGVAAAYCAEALFAVAAETVQLHGGIAITWEHEAHRYLKRAHAGLHLLGTPAGHRARLGTAVGR
ncbi:MAG: acyl-CoA dehydrogenase [Jatrophihabitans sp.]|nr:MAG: acyl-CoA dehydrogenase [Jatrophihabitans sp.]